MIDYLTEKLGEVEALILAGLTVVVIWAVAMVFIKTRALIPTAVMLVVGGLVLWGTANSEWFAEKIGEEADAAPAVVVPLHPAPAGDATVEVPVDAAVTWTFAA